MFERICEWYSDKADVRYTTAVLRVAAAMIVVVVIIREVLLKLTN